MRAAVLQAYNEPVVIEDLRASDLGPHDVRVRVDASGVCHTDLTILQGGMPVPPPCILGHEGAGTVLEVGDAVSRVKVGDRIVPSFSSACGDCWHCLHDQSNLCMRIDGMVARRGFRPDGTAVLAAAGLGTLADEMVIHEIQAVKVESDLPDEQLALIGCAVTTGVGAALNTARVRPGSSVAVVGCGGVGQAVVQGARVAGAARIFAVDPVGSKRKAAEAFGATDLIDPSVGDPVGQVRDATGGRGADYAFEVIGRPETILQAYNTARRGGTVVIVGTPSTDATVTFSAFQLFLDEKRTLGCVYGSSQVRRDFQRFVDLAEAGQLDLGAMVSRRITLDEINDAFRAIEVGEVIRTVVV
jgi:S-(hydroxymethyl)glutathione dehydrogenase/alcohol dehydrogenase